MKDYFNLRKSKLLLFMLLTAFAGGVSPAWAEDVTLTVHDGTTTNAFVPVYGYYCDGYTKAEMIMPSSELSDMAGGKIKGMVFYANTASASMGNASSVYKVFLKEVSTTTISAFSGYAESDVVYTHNGILSVADNKLTITFDSKYTYGGGNLLIGLYKTVTGGSCPSFSFYGETISEASVGGGSSSTSITATQRNFLPKTTFTYEPLTGPGFAVKDYANGATVAFGKIAANGTKDITLKNPGTESVTVNITTTGGYTVANSSITIAAKGEQTLTITAPAETANGIITMTPTADGVAAISLNLSCVVPESDRIMSDFSGDTWPAGWTYTNNGAGWKFYEGAVYYWNSSTMSTTPTNDFVTTKYKVSSGDVMMFDAYKNSAAYSNSYVSLKVYKSTDGETWGDPIASYTGADMETSFTSFTIEDIPAGSYYFKFTANQVCLDNIYGFLPAVEPKELAVTKSGTSATLTWTAANTETNWQVFASTDADAINSASPINVTSTATYTFNELTVGATYYAWVRSKFGEDNYSDWVRTTFALAYRAAAPTSVDGSGITNVTFGTGAGIVNNSTRPTSSPYYGDYSTQEGLVWPDFETTVAITFGTNYEYGTVVWVDWNQNYEFEDSEIVFAGESAKATGSVLNATFTIPANQAIGKYRMRIAAADTYYDSHKTLATAAGADPYPTGTYCVVHDYTLNVTTAPSVLAPTDLTASNETYNSVELSWTAGSDETEWKVIYGAAGFDPASTGTTIDNVTENPYTLTGLTAETDYDVYVKAVKGSDVSLVSNKATFTTLEKYPAPTGLEISNLKATSATLTWTAGTATSWEVAISETNSEPTEAGTVVNAATYDFSGLTAETTYYAFVRVKAGDEYGKWSAACEFTPTAAIDLTIFDKTDTNSYLPVWGQTDYSSKTYTQFIIPSSVLTPVKDGKIKKLTFYSSDANKTLKSYSVYIQETDNTIFTSNDASSMEGTLVYSGDLTISDNKMEVAFTSPFTYTGRNLQIGFSQNNIEKSVAATWYGENQSTNVGIRTYRGGETKAYLQFLPKTTINYIAYVSENPTLVITDPNSQILTESPATHEFGLTATAETHNFTLQNTGLGSLTVKSIAATGGYLLKIGEGEAAANIGSTVIGAKDDSPVTLQVIQPAGSSEGAITITTDVNGDDVDETFVINVSGMVRDASKLYESGFTALPTGWTSEGNWSYSAANGAYTQAWYIDQQTLARLKTPKLTVAEGEKFIIEAKGYSTTNTEYQHLVLQYSADGTDWTTAGSELELDPSNWKTFTVTGVPAGEYYIGLLASQADIRLFYGGEKITGANFAINTDGSEQDFGSVIFNSTAKKTYNITNNGDKPLFVTISNPADFTAEMTANAEDNNVYFTDALGWGAPNVYYWPNGGNWPGVPMTELYTNEHGQKVYYYELPANVEGVVFNGNGKQTVNIDAPNGKAYYTINETDGSNYKVGTWTFNNCVPAGKSSVLTVSMNTASSGDKSGDVVLTFDALNKTSFTIPCTGNVKDENYLYVDFADGFPTGWQVGANWDASSGSAVQSSTTTASAFVTTPLTVDDNETMSFKVKRASTGTKSLKVRYSNNGGANWSDYTNYGDDFGSGFEDKELTGVPAGTVIVEFLGNNIILDDIEGFTKTTKPAIAIIESATAVANGDEKDFGFLSENGTATYTVKNIGNATLKAAISGEGVSVSPANNIEVAAGSTQDITVTLAYGEPYGERTGMTMTIDSEDEWISDFVVNFKATLNAPTDFVEDFSGNETPAGWYNGGWTVSGEASIATSTSRDLITKKVEAAEGKNVLTFKAKYSNENLSKTLNVYTSTDRKTWTLKKEYTLTANYADVTLDALEAGQYYVKFEAANAIIDNVQGLKKVDLPDHDLYLVSATLPTDEIMPIDTYTATVKVASLRANETVAAELYFGENKVGELTDQVINNGATVELKPSATGIAAGTYEVYAKVYNDNASVETEKVSVTVADKTELSLTGFTAVTKNATADNDNMFTAEFNVTVKNTGSTTFTADQVSVTVTDKDNKDLKTATWTPGETIYLKAGNYTADNANFAIYRWSTDSDQEWALFTGGTDGIYSASLNGKDNFIICRVNPATPVNELSFNNGVCWTKSEDLTTVSGVVFENNGYKNGLLNLTQSNNFIAGMSAIINVTVTAAAGNGGEFEFNAKENVSGLYWSPDLGYKQTVNVTAAPPIVLNEDGDGTFETGTNRKVTLNRSFVEGWNTVCLPFAVSNITRFFGDDAYAYDFTGYSDEEGLTFSKVDELTAAKPYLVYVPTAITDPIIMEDIEISNASATPATTTNDKVSFIGTYSSIAANSTLVGKYVVGNDADKGSKIFKATDKTTMKGFRAYFSSSDGARLSIVLNDDVQGIRAIMAAEEIAPEGVYNLNGQKVEQLKKGGLYIINGKKQVVK